MKKKIIFITGEDLLDVDMPIVKEIHNSYDFLWIVILRGYNWFSSESIINFCETNNIKYKLLLQPFKLKDLRVIIFHIKLIKFLKSLNPNVIYDSYHGIPHFHFIAPFYLRKEQFVIAIHDVEQHFNMGYRQVRSLYSDFLIKKYNHIHLFSQNQKEVFHKKYTNLDRNILVAPLCLKNFGASPDSTIKYEGIINFLFFGIIRENKGVDILIDAVNILSKRHKNFKVTIAGKSENNCWENLETSINDKSYYDLKIRTIEKNEVTDLFARAHFVILPYKDITQSGVLLTAYNYHTPAIASNLPGFVEYINDNETGLLFDVNDPNSVAIQMEKALNMGQINYAAMCNKLRYHISNEIDNSSISNKYIEYFDNM